MTTKAVIGFREADAPIREPVTKFGGQPAWIDEPAWPLSRETGRPMRFIGQVALDPRHFGTVPARMAYLFMTDEEEFVDGTYEPDGGENDVVLQPGRFAGPTTEQAEGPTLYRMVQRPGSDRLVPEPCEFGATLDFVEDAEARSAEGEDEPENYTNQVGGTPTFLQGEEYPAGGALAASAPTRLVVRAVPRQLRRRRGRLRVPLRGRDRRQVPVAMLLMGQGERGDEGRSSESQGGRLGAGWAVVERDVASRRSRGA